MTLFARPDIDYWILRNMFSLGWGEEGYMRLARRTRPNMACGRLDSLIYPLL